MKIVKIEDLHCDAGWRVNSFLKITTDEGIVGWSEYMEGYGAQGLTGVIRKLAERLIGQDPRPVERHSAFLYAATRQAAGGVNAMAIAAIENALVDIKAKALGVPVYEMLGGPIRDTIRHYSTANNKKRIGSALGSPLPGVNHHGTDRQDRAIPRPARRPAPPGSGG